MTSRPALFGPDESPAREHLAQSKLRGAGSGRAGENLFPPDTVNSAAMREAIVLLERFAPFDHISVLLEGEMGTGKTYFARHLHALSPRAERSLVHVDLATLDDNLAGADLFGHIPGAFTGANKSRFGLFATANGSTLFLDEIGKSSKRMQGQLLSAVERGVVRPLGSDRDVYVDVRLAVGTNIPIETLVASGSFLPDLASRLGLCRIRIPPLRNRKSDIPALIRVSVARQSPSFKRTAPAVDEDLVRAMQLAPWPGNLRELDGTVQYLLVRSEGDAVLTLRHCDHDLTYLRDLARGREVLPLTLADIEIAISRSGSISQAAREFGVARSTLQRYLRKGRTTPRVAPMADRPQESVVDPLEEV